MLIDAVPPLSSSVMSDSHSVTKQRPDPFKDSLWRFLGYANEVGEALRPLVPVGFVWATYAVAIGYAAADTYDKASYEYKVRISLYLIVFNIFIMRTVHGKRI